MTIAKHAERFAGRPIRNYDPAAGINNPTRVVYRLRLDWDAYRSKANLTDVLAQFLDDPNAAKVPGIVIGAWSSEGGDSSAIVEALVAARDRLPELKAIFLGDITYEEQEISWIRQSDISPLLAAYPHLESFRVRGNQGLRLGKVQHAALKSLVIETGGLSAEVVGEVGAAELPELEHLELWLGTANYGGDATVADLKPILDGKRFPKLLYLGLRDSEMADDVAVAVAEAPVLEQIRVLDLSLGNLSDRGAKALLNSPAIRHLELLDIHHHYVSPEVVKWLRSVGLSLGITINADDPREPDQDGDEEFRYVAVSE
jgi:hypothetical protein